MSEVKLDSEGFLITPLHRIMHGVLLEGWHHHEGLSYRFYREEPETRGHQLRGDSPVLTQEYVPAATDNPFLNDLFKEAARVYRDGDVWRIQVTLPMERTPSIEQSYSTRLAAVSACDKILSKYVLMDVSEEPLSLREMGFQRDSMKIALAALLSNVRDYDLDRIRSGGGADTVLVRASIAHLRLALDLIGELRKVEAADAVGA